MYDFRNREIRTSQLFSSMIKLNSTFISCIENSALRALVFRDSSKINHQPTLTFNLSQFHYIFELCY